jgi:hypothetical protein
MDSSNLNIKNLILVPAAITLGITILRLVGELNEWSPILFGREAGGGFSIIGISWLPLIFGPYFAAKLMKMGHGPTSAGKLIGFSCLALVVYVGISTVTFLVTPNFAATVVAFIIGAIIAVWIVSKTWPALFKTLLAYAFAARIPVAILMIFAIFGQWGTHYDAPAPGQPEMGPFATWVMIGLLPQMTTWIAFTVIIGSLFGGITAALTKKSGAKETQENPA